MAFINEYNDCDDLEGLFEKYDVDLEVRDKFFDVFSDGVYPLIKIIDDENYDEILKLSKDMRNNIRGEDIGGLG